MKNYEVNICVFGSGALASYYSAIFSSKSRVCIFSNWIERKLHVQKNGLIVDGVNYFNIETNTDLFPNKFDFTFIINKATRNKDVVNKIKQSRIDFGEAFLLQNGVGGEDFFKNVGINVTRLISNFGAKFGDNFEIETVGESELILPRSNVSSNLISFFQTTKVNYTTNDGFEKLVYEKLAVNAVINTLTALSKKENGAILSELKSKAIELIKEIFPFFKTRNVFNSIEEMHELVFKVAESTFSNKSSMLYDVENNRETEIDWILLPIIKELSDVSLTKEIYDQLVFRNK